MFIKKYLSEVLRLNILNNELINKIMNEESLVNLTKKINQDFDEIKNLPDCRKTEIDKALVELIKHNENLDSQVQDDIRELGNFAWESLGFGIALYIFINSASLPLIIKLPLLCLIIIFCITALIKIYYFYNQSGYRYFFLYLNEFGNQWKWFYYGNEHITKIKIKSKDIKDYRENVANYLKGLEFVTRKFKDETLEERIKSNLVQNYLLQVLVYYRNKFQLRMLEFDIWLKRILLYISIFYFCILIIIYLFFPTIFQYLQNNSFINN